MKVLVTGAAGFIGYHVAEALLLRGDTVVGVDNLNDYYEPQLKQARLSRLHGRDAFAFTKLDIADRDGVAALMREQQFQRVVHLAAQPGVRYSLSHPHAYVDANLVGFMNILEGCRHSSVEHLVYASSSSVYGANKVMPFSTSHNVDHPVSLYAATKKANELMAHTYAHLYRLPVTGLRFFTVYGPWGRPDMAPFIFTRQILAGDVISVFNNGKHARDFTYIDDVVAGVISALDRVAAASANWDDSAPDPGISNAPYTLYNVGNSQPVELLDFIAVIEKLTGRTARMELLPMQPGDVERTCADIGDFVEAAGYAPKTSIEDGLAKFVAWYRDYYAVA